MSTIGESISRVRNSLKAVKEDAFLTDRTIFFAITKYAQTLIKREDNQFKLMKMSSIFQVLPYIELIDVDKVEAGCIGVYSGCYFKRSKDKIPSILNGAFGPVIRTVSSIDSSIELYRTEPGLWLSMTKTTTFKYNKNLYFWYLDDYLYFPNLDWDAIRMEAIFDGYVDSCSSDPCELKQDMPLNIPAYLFSEVEQYAVKELSMSLQIPPDTSLDGQNILR
jgi:hypothetical protein